MKGLRVRFTSAQLGGEDGSLAKEVRHDGEHLGDVPL